MIVFRSHSLLGSSKVPVNQTCKLGVLAKMGTLEMHHPFLFTVSSGVTPGQQCFVGQQTLRHHRTQTG